MTLFSSGSRQEVGMDGRAGEAAVTVWSWILINCFCCNCCSTTDGRIDNCAYNLACGGNISVCTDSRTRHIQHKCLWQAYLFLEKRISVSLYIRLFVGFKKSVICFDAYARYDEIDLSICARSINQSINQSVDHSVSQSVLLLVVLVLGQPWSPGKGHWIPQHWSLWRIVIVHYIQGVSKKSSPLKRL